MIRWFLGLKHIQKHRSFMVNKGYSKNQGCKLSTTKNLSYKTSLFTYFTTIHINEIN